MKSIRFLVLMMAVSTFPAFVVQAYAQQEVAPDHFDEVPATVAASPKAHADHKAGSSHHQASHVRLASKHSGKSHHHQARTSA
ncbi:MAG: hypothetical protein WCC87_22570 [Candidatus Korobacteraceae bacterium]